MEPIYIICFVLSVGTVVCFMLYHGIQKRYRQARERVAALESEKLNAATFKNAETDSLRLKIEEAAARENELKNSIAVKDQRTESLVAEIAELKTWNEALRAKLEDSGKELEKIEERFKAEFRNLANEILEEKSSQFKRTNKESLDNLLKPFKDNMELFRQRVETIYTEENKERGALQNEIKNLMELNRKITEETENLTRALKGNSKVQGDWGEMILETILESSNLVRGLHYTTQTNVVGEEGNNLRPDVILNLPDKKKIVIDSKVSLTAFVAMCECDDHHQRSSLSDEHNRSVRRHVQELGTKRYHELLDSPDFVIMFVPNEPAFLAALQSDPSIWSDAYNKKVIISSPTNLFALLKIVDDLWKRDSQNKNALDIAAEGSKLYEKFVGFVDTLESLGKNISNISSAYDKAMKQLKEGSGNLIGRAEKLRKLGIKASKTLDTETGERSLSEIED